LARPRPPPDRTTPRPRLRERDPPDAQARPQVLEAQDGAQPRAGRRGGGDEAPPDELAAPAARTRDRASPPHLELHRHRRSRAGSAARKRESEPAARREGRQPGARQLELAATAARVAEGGLEPARVHAQGQRDAVLAPRPARLPPQDRDRLRQARPLGSGVEMVAEPDLVARSATAAAG